MKISPDTAVNEFDSYTLDSMILVLTRHKHFDLINRELGNSNSKINPSYALGVAFEVVMAVIRNNVFSQLSEPSFEMDEFDVDAIIADTGLYLYLSKEIADTLVQRALWEGCLFSALEVQQITYTPDDLLLFSMLGSIYGFEKVKLIYKHATKIEPPSVYPKVPFQNAVKEAQFHLLEKGIL